MKGALESMTEEERKNPDQFYITDSRNQKKINNQITVYSDDSYLVFDPVSSSDTKTSLYQIFNGRELPVRYGRWMEQDHEIVVPYNVAQKIQRKEQMLSVEEVLGITCFVSMPKHTSSSFAGEDEILDVTTFTIVGITYYGSDTENQVFLREGVWDKLSAEFYGFQDDVNYQYIDFIVADQAESDKTAKEIDELLDSTESHFVTKSSSASVEEDYQNTTVFYAFIVSICVAMVAILIISHLVIRKRERKEVALLRWYGYHPLLVTLVRVLFIFLIVGIIQVLFLPTISETLNQFASSLGFDSMLNQDVSRYLVSSGSSLLIVLLIELAFQRKQKRR